MCTQTAEESEKSDQEGLENWIKRVQEVGEDGWRVIHCWREMCE